MYTFEDEEAGEEEEEEEEDVLDVRPKAYQKRNQAHMRPNYNCNFCDYTSHRR